MTDAELLTQIEAAIANHPGADVVQEDGKRVEYTSFDDLIKQRNYLTAKIASENSTFRRRTLAKNGGR